MRAQKLLCLCSTTPHTPDPSERHSASNVRVRAARPRPLHPNRVDHNSRGQMAHSTLTTCVVPPCAEQRQGVPRQTRLEIDRANVTRATGALVEIGDSSGPNAWRTAAFSY